MEIENNLLVLTMTKLTKCKISQVKQRPLIKFNKVLLGFCGNKKKSDPNHVQSNRNNNCCYHHHHYSYYCYVGRHGFTSFACRDLIEFLFVGTTYAMN